MQAHQMLIEQPSKGRMFVISLRRRRCQIAQPRLQYERVQLQIEYLQQHYGGLTINFLFRALATNIKGLRCFFVFLLSPFSLLLLHLFPFLCTPNSLTLHIVTRVFLEWPLAKFYFLDFLMINDSILRSHTINLIAPCLSSAFPHPTLVGTNNSHKVESEPWMLADCPKVWEIQMRAR